MQDIRGFEYLQKERGIRDRQSILDFGAGFASGNLLEVIPPDGEVIDRLKQIGILNDKGRELFYGCVVFPLLDHNNNVVSVYGRRIDEGEIKHLYLPGKKRGLINRQAAKRSKSLILTDFFAQVTLPESVKQFRDDPKFYQRIRGIRKEIVKPTEKNIESIISSFDKIYKIYLEELSRGFLMEIKSDFDLAQYRYEKCLKILIHEEQNYYTNIDLARLSLKKKEPIKAEKYLTTYLEFFSQEIKAGKGLMTDIFFGYVPSNKTLKLMKEEQEKLKIVLVDLQAFNRGGKSR